MKRPQPLFSIALVFMLLWQFLGRHLPDAVYRGVGIAIALSVVALAVWYMIDWWHSFETKKTP